MRTMRPSRVIAISDIAALSFAATVLVRPSVLSFTYAVVSFGVMWAGGAYRPRMYYRLWTHIPALLGQLTVYTLIVSLWPDPRRTALLQRLPFVVAAVIVARAFTYASLRLVRARSRRPEEALIIGADRPGCLVADALTRSRACGIRPIGFVDSGPVRPDTPLPVLGDLAQLEEVVERLGVKHVILAHPGDHSLALGTTLWHCQTRDVDVWVVPPLFEVGVDPCGRSTDDVWAIPFQHLRRPGQHTAARLVKRVFDCTVAGLLVLVASPVLLVVAAAVRLTSPGPVFFRQKRVGQGGREFELLKFRTMTVNDDSDTKWSVKGDQRLTSVGGLLRRTSLDELPQLLNVLRGDMSLVGPRPERPFFAAHFAATVAHYEERLRGPVGITGWAQVHGLRGDTSIVERTRFDNFYIEHWSLRLDVVILVRTLSAILHWMVAGEAPAPGLLDDRPDIPLPSAVAVAVPVQAGSSPG